MKRAITIAAVIGFLVPILWGTVALIGSGTRESPATDFFWSIVYITCPPWLITQPPFGYGPVTAVINAALYGTIASIFYPLVKRLRRVLRG